MSDTKLRVLVVDDERDVREPLAQYLRTKGFSMFTAADGLEALEKISKETINIVLTDVQMPKMGGLDLLRKIKTVYPSVDVIIFTAFGSVEMAVEAIKAGAQDYVMKPIVFEEIRQKLQNLKPGKPTGVRGALSQGLEAIIGKSPEVIELKTLIRQVAKAGSYAMIQGESGTGKELVARALHFESSRKDSPFMAVNCAAIPEHLLEAEFFGHARGAFTGAVTDKKGFFEIANGGTLFLDEIGDLPLNMQAKLLRAIETGEILPLGKTATVAVDVNIIAATAKVLSDEVTAGRFREDLFFRINVIEIKVPSLRDRIDDIRLLADHFLEEVRRSLQADVVGFTAETYSAMESYRWQGNIRELRNVIERAVVLCQADTITLDNLPDYITRMSDEPQTDPDYRRAMKRFERTFILKTLKSCNYDKKLAAKVLGVGLSSLYRKLDELGIEA